MRHHLENTGQIQVLQPSPVLDNQILPVPLFDELMQPAKSGDHGVANRLHTP
jgi:hypothetical protein